MWGNTNRKQAQNRGGGVELEKMGQILKKNVQRVKVTDRAYIFLFTPDCGSVEKKNILPSRRFVFFFVSFVFLEIRRLAAYV
jgi:hypothetical protein